MKRLILTLLFLSSFVFADQAEYMFEQGVLAYQNGEYEQAINHFESALNHGKASAALYYNLGNAYYKIGEIGPSILYYERAKQLAPHDPDIEFNLNVAQLRVVDKIPSPEMDYFFKLWTSIKHALTLPQLTAVTLGLYVLLFLLFITRLFSPSSVRDIVRYSTLPVLVLLLISTFLFVIRVREDVNVQNAIILSDKVSVTSGPADDATEVFALHEGVKVRVIDRSGDFVRIRLSDGKDGWVPQSTLDVI